MGAICPNINIGTSSAAQTINIGTGAGSSVINLGGSGDVVSIAGTLTTINTTNLAVSDKIATLNKSGLTSSGFNAGVEIEEGGVITGYARTSADRTYWELKAPASATVIGLNQSLKTTDNVTFNQITGNVIGNASTVTTNANLTGEVTSVGNAATLANSAVIGKVLTGFSASAGTVSASDTILTAIGKNSGTLGNATSSATASTLMLRDGSGSVSVNALNGTSASFHWW